MAIQSAVFTFALPEDHDSNQLRILASTTRDGTYTLVGTVDYDYGITEYEYDELDDTLWYVIQFHNTTDNESGPLSEPVYGGTFTESGPFLAVSTTTDGVAYATTQDVYDYSGLTAAEVTQTRVAAALRSARSQIDFRTAEMGLNRFDVFETGVARRKYNATLRLIKEAEINIALSVLYTNLSDDLIINNMREGAGAGAGSISIGSTSIDGNSLAERNESILFLATLAGRYAAEGERILSSLDTTSVRLVGYDFIIRFPRFRYPFNGY